MTAFSEVVGARVDDDGALKKGSWSQLKVYDSGFVDQGINVRNNPVASVVYGVLSDFGYVELEEAGMDKNKGRL